MTDDDVLVLCSGGTHDGRTPSVSLASVAASLPVTMGEDGMPYRWFGLSSGETMILEPADEISMWWRSLDPGERATASDCVRSGELNDSLLQALDKAPELQASLAFQAQPERSGRMPADVERFMKHHYER